MEPNRIRKSLSNECTYSQNLRSLGACENAIDELIADLQAELGQKASLRQIRKAFVKVKFADFSRTTKECLSHEATREVFHALLKVAYSRKEKHVRLLGVGVRFEEEHDEESNQILMPF